MIDDVGFVLLAEVLQRRQHRVGRRFAELAEASELHPGGQGLDLLDVALFAPSLDELVVDDEQQRRQQHRQCDDQQELLGQRRRDEERSSDLRERLVSVVETNALSGSRLRRHHM